MIICNNCKSIFSEPEIIKEDMGECWGTPVTEDIPICPYCGFDSVEEAKECNNCNRITNEDNFGTYICIDCEQIGIINQERE